MATTRIMPEVAYRENADELAQWTLQRFVNRRDVWGAYSRNGAYTAPARIRRGKESLGLNTLHNHFGGRGSVGVHCLGQDDRCKWFAFDVDAHSDDVDAGAKWSSGASTDN